MACFFSVAPPEIILPQFCHNLFFFPCVKIGAQCRYILRICPHLADRKWLVTGGDIHSD